MAQSGALLAAPGERPLKLTARAMVVMGDLWDQPWLWAKLVLVLILSGVSEMESKVRSFGFGADDYVTKPFHREELVARIQAVVRRSKGHSQSIIRTGKLAAFRPSGRFDAVITTPEPDGPTLAYASCRPMEA